MFTRPLIIAAVLGIAHVSVLFIERGYTLGEVTAPAQDLTQLPQRIGPWTGEELELDDHLRDFLQARSGIDRVYRRATGDSVTAHVIWTDDYIKVHFPQQCYRQSGWNQTSERDVQIEVHEMAPRFSLASSVGDNTEPENNAAAQFTAKLLTLEQDDNQIQVLYWFQMGDEMFFDRLQHRTTRRKLCWGNREWPPLVKVMLQSSGRRSEEHLKDMAGRIYSWMQAE